MLLKMLACDKKTKNILYMYVHAYIILDLLSLLPVFETNEYVKSCFYASFSLCRLENS